MAGYTPWMAGAVSAAKRGQAAAERRHRDAKLEEYREYRAEARACGYEVETFAEWMGEESFRETSEIRVAYEG